MGHCLVKLYDGALPFYIEWSTIVDAPITRDMSRGEAIEEFGHRRVARCDKNGTSRICEHASAEDTVWLNRAGPNESRLSMRGIVLLCLGWGPESLGAFTVPDGGRLADEPDYWDEFYHWQEHDNRARASCGRWP